MKDFGTIRGKKVVMLTLRRFHSNIYERFWHDKRKGGCHG